MNEKHLGSDFDDFLQEEYNNEIKTALEALRRAAKIARQTAIDTNTNLVIFKDGILTLIPPAELEADSLKNLPAKP
jgi:hypothetical protein